MVASAQVCWSPQSDSNPDDDQYPNSDQRVLPLVRQEDQQVAGGEWSSRRLLKLSQPGLEFGEALAAIQEGDQFPGLARAGLTRQVIVIHTQVETQRAQFVFIEVLENPLMQLHNFTGEDLLSWAMGSLLCLSHGQGQQPRALLRINRHYPRKDCMPIGHKNSTSDLGHTAAFVL